MKRTLPLGTVVLLLILLLWPHPAYAMHIPDGTLTLDWAAIWWAAALPFVGVGLAVLKRRREADPKAMPLVAMVGAAIFVISCMPVPIPGVGSCAHPCGVGLGALLLGPWLTMVVASVALALQALFLTHGGVTSLGANLVSMGVVGVLAAYAVFQGLSALRVPLFVAALAAGLSADWATYATTSWQLALVANEPVGVAFTTYLIAFLPTQVPLGIVEGVMTAVAYRFVRQRRPDLVALPRPVRCLAGTGV